MQELVVKERVVLKRILILIFCASASLLVAACGSSTTMEQTWRAPQPEANLHNVVTAYISRDGAMRRSAEDSMAARLNSRGIHAVPAYAVLTDMDLQDRAAARSKLISQGFDGVVAIQLIGAHTEVQVEPTFVGYWGGAWAYDNAYLTTQTVVRVETNVYSLRDDRLVWSGVSRTIDPSSTSSAIASVTKKVAKHLEHQGIVATAGGGAPAS